MNVVERKTPAPIARGVVSGVRGRVSRATHRRSLPLGALLCALVLSAALVASGTAPAARPKPEGVLVQALKYLSLGQYVREYNLLHPGQKRLIRRPVFVECWRRSVPRFDLLSIKKIGQRRARIRLTGVPQRVAEAVTFRVTARSGGSTDTFTQTWNAVWTGSRWAWVLVDANVKALARGNCPGS